MSFEEEYFDVLRAIELAIHGAYQQNRNLVDYQVEKALDAAIRLYSAEAEGKSAPRLKLNTEEDMLLRRIQQVCQLHLGRDSAVPVGEQSRSVEEIIACLKRIKRSVSQMSKKGRQAYLTFIDDFFTE